MTSDKSTTRHNRPVTHEGKTTAKTLGALGALALTAGLVVAAGGPASAHYCDVGVSGCRGVHAPASSVHNYP